MASAETPRFTLDHAGHRYGVETASSGLNTIARLFVDGKTARESSVVSRES